MLDRKMNKKILMAILTTGFASAVMFNSCSDVSFKSGSSVDGRLGNPDGENPDGDPTGSPNSPGSPDSPGSPCGDLPCDELKAMSEIITVPIIGRKTDILLVLDNSGSMSVELKELGSRLSGFVEKLDQKNIDWQMCLVLTDGSGATQYWKKKIGGFYYKTDMKVLKQTEPDRENIFDATVSNFSKNGSGVEQGIVAMTKAVKSSNNQNCYRSDAALSVILISDEDEKSCGGTCEDHPGTENHSAEKYQEQYREILEEDQPETFVAAVENLWPQKPLTVHSIVIKNGDTACYEIQDAQNPAFYGTFYSALSELTAGTIGDICASSYSAQLEEVGETIESSLASITLKCPPVGTPNVIITPKPATEVSQRVEGNKIFFTPSLSGGTRIDVDYYCK